MKLTKYGHACVVLEEQGQRLVIDPGAYTPDLGDIANTVGIVITHVHADHFDPGNIAKILAGNPDVHIWGTQQVAEQLGNPKVQVVDAGSTADITPFKLRFYGSKHAIIHPDFPQDQNVGILVNDDFYYPGDSFTVPEGATVKTLALPVGGPWLKIGEAIDFVRAIKPRECFPTHNAPLSDIGQASVNQWVGGVCGKQSTAFTMLQIGESLEL